MNGAGKIAVRVSEITPLNDLVTRFRFHPIDGGLLPAFSGGAHVVVDMQDGAITRRNPYSLMSDPFDQTAYTICVRRDDHGRGGSLFMHQRVRVGDQMVISTPMNLFPLDLRARKHLMIAGGIGITPFLAQIKQLTRTSGDWELHYACRSAALGSYVNNLTARFPDDVHFYHDDQGQAIDLETLLERQPLGTHLYVCGPGGMITWVRGTAADLGWPREAVHHEAFLAPQPGKPFQVKLALSNKVITVAAQESLLEAMERAGVNAPCLCRGGVCGQCETRVITHDGTFLHHDHWLDDHDHASGKKIMPCVSRFDGRTLVLER